MIKIIGAGMSGLAAGITLSLNGHNTTVFEQHSKIGMGCGHNVMAIRNYGLPYDQMEKFNKMHLKLRDVKPIYKIVKYAPSGRSMDVFSKTNPILYAVMRGDSKYSFDVQLKDQFEKVGGKIEYGVKKSLHEGDIIATRGIFKNFWCVGQEFVDVNIDSETILFFMDNRYCPQGYIYLMPYGKNELSIAATTYDLNCPLPLLFKKFLDENAIVSKILEGSTKVGDFGCEAYSNIPKTAKIKDKLFVGAAAGFIESARGFGVKYALESGVLAGKSINDGLNYDTLWKKEFEQDLMDGFTRRLSLTDMTNADYEKLILKEKVHIQSYDKWPKEVKQLLQKITVTNALGSWRKKYDLNKLF